MEVQNSIFAPGQGEAHISDTSDKFLGARVVPPGAAANTKACVIGSRTVRRGGGIETSGDVPWGAL